MTPHLRTFAAWVISFAAFVAGCASDGVTRQAWVDGPATGFVVTEGDYRLHTTISDPRRLDAVIDTLRRTRPIYDELVPPRDGLGPADAFVFAYREEWADHTRRTTGDRAALYLTIDRGGFAEKGAFSTFFSGSDAKLLQTVRHEGLHQHFDRHLAMRPPPFLEEGLATLFEEGFERGDLSRPRSSFQRLFALSEGVRRRRVWPLERLLAMHAGHVVGARDYRQVQTFYAQAWAFAHFLTSERPDGLRRLLRRYGDGSAPRDPLRALSEALDTTPEQLSRDFEAHVRNLVDASR